MSPAAEGEPPRPRPSVERGRPAVQSVDLFRGAYEIVIVHAGEEYRLRITRAGKLLLTK